jgi:hypothetical protein
MQQAHSVEMALFDKTTPQASGLSFDNAAPLPAMYYGYNIVIVHPRY